MYIFIIQSLLIHLQEKAENQMNDARKAQERLAAHANSFPYAVSPTLNGLNQQDILKVDKNRCTPENQLQKDTRKAHDRLSGQSNGFPFVFSPVMNGLNQQEMYKVDKNQCPDVNLPFNVNGGDSQGLVNGVEGREQMLRLLDARDNELCGEQVALQKKLQDLNSKKQQIDQLVSQLHHYATDEDESEGSDDMTKQIKQIVAMKDQLATLKGELVSNLHANSTIFVFCSI